MVGRWSVMVAVAAVLTTSACSGSRDDGGGATTDGTGTDDGSGSGSTQGPGSEGSQDSADETGDDGPPPEPAATVSELLIPFDANREDLVGPSSWATHYGKPPEIVALPDGSAIDVLAQDHTAPGLGRAVLMHLEPALDDYVVTRYVVPPLVDRIMGLARDEAGALYVASGIVESDDISVRYPTPDEYRAGIVRVVKLDWEGTIAFDTDLDLARQAAAEDPEQLINPMVAATSRMAYGAGTLALVHGLNTKPDNGGVRHQKAITTHVDATTGEVTRASSIWVSHSFDQRVFHDGTGFLELHLGDAFPRHIAFARVEPDSGEYPLLHIKGPTGENNTRTRLGNVALLDEAAYGYIALFATEPTTGTTPLPGGPDVIAGSRDLAVVRVLRDFDTLDDDTMDHLDPALPDALEVQSGDALRQNRLRWLTSYHAETNGHTHAERPKLVAIGGDHFIVLWERWETEGNGETFSGTWGMVIDGHGDVVADARLLTSDHLPRGDDAFAIGAQAVWITGDNELRQLELHFVDSALDYRTIVVE